MKKTVAFIFREMGTGGAQKIQAFVANMLDEEGFDVIAINMGSSKITVCLNSNIRVIDCIYDNVLSYNNRIMTGLAKLNYLIKLRRVIKQINPILVVSFLSDVVRISVIALTGTNIPIIGSERGDPTIFSNEMFKKYKKAYLKCNGVVFQLPKVKDYYDLPETVRQTVIPNPCTPRQDCFAKQVNNNSHKIIGAGRLCEQKRFDVLIDAFEEVYQKYPEYSLIIYGDGPLHNELVNHTLSLSCKECVKFAGNVNDVFKIASDAEFFVLSSDYEGIPNVLLEAMGSGIPCLSTDCSPGGSDFLLKHGQLGLLSTCGDSHMLAMNMIYYIENPLIRSKYSEAGRSVLTEYSNDNIKNKWKDFIKEVLYKVET